MSERWADDGAAEEHLRDGNYLALQQSSNAWNERLAVERGQSRQRLDMGHGFLQSIIRNQKDRDAYEQAWQTALDSASPQEKEWGRPNRMDKGGEDWAKPKHWRSFLGKEGEEMSSPDPAEDESPGNEGGDCKDVTQLNWKEAQRRQAEILEQERAEEEAAALQNQKRRSGRGHFTFTDGHPKGRRSRVSPALVTQSQQKKGEGVRAESHASGSPPLSEEEAEAESPAEPARVRKEVRVRAGFGAYAPPKRVSATLPPAEESDQKAEPRGPHARALLGAADAPAKMPLPLFEGEQAGGAEAGGEAAGCNKGGTPAPSHKEEEEGEAAGHKGKVRKEVRVRPGFGTYTAPKRTPCKEDPEDAGDDPPPGFENRAPAAEAAMGGDRAAKPHQGEPKQSEKPGARTARKKQAAAGERGPGKAKGAEAGLASMGSLNAEAAEFKPPPAASGALSAEAAEFKPPPAEAGKDEGTALNAKAAEWKPRQSRRGSNQPRNGGGTSSDEEEVNTDPDTSQSSIPAPEQCESPVKAANESPAGPVPRGSPAVAPGSVKKAAKAFAEKVAVANGEHAKSGMSSSAPEPTRTGKREGGNDASKRLAHSWDEATIKAHQPLKANGVSPVKASPGNVLEKVQMMEKVLHM